MLAAGYGIFSGSETEWAGLKFKPEQARWVMEEQWHPQQRTELLQDGSLLLELPYANPTELVMDILRYGAGVEVMAPPQLRRQVQDHLQSALAVYAGGRRRPLMFRILAASLALLLSACSRLPPKGIEPVSPFELQRYLGQWYEIARLDHAFERGLSDIGATYSLNDDGSVRVLNRGYDSERKANGKKRSGAPSSRETPTRPR